MYQTDSQDDRDHREKEREVLRGSSLHSDSRRRTSQARPDPFVGANSTWTFVSGLDRPEFSFAGCAGRAGPARVGV